MSFNVSFHENVQFQIYIIHEFLGEMRHLEVE